MRITISRESLVLIAICFLDMVLTMLVVGTGRAVEANPLMAYCINCGLGHFCLAKLLTVVPFVIVTEWYRRQNPVFVKRAIWAGIAAYVGLYFGLLAAVNAA